jgi:septal ring factor EnvC (AmiA/AmiB activator)
MVRTGRSSRINHVYSVEFSILNLDEKKPIIPSLSESSSNEDLNEKLQQLELFRLENEQLRSKLDTHKTELHVLRNERESLVNTISKLNSELIQAENQLLSRFQTRNK